MKKMMKYSLKTQQALGQWEAMMMVKNISQQMNKCRLKNQRNRGLMDKIKEMLRIFKHMYMSMDKIKTKEKR